MLNILKNDDLNGLKAFISSGYNEKDLAKEFDGETPKMLLHSPPLISVAAYFGSIKCVIFMIREGYDLFTADLIHFY